MNFVSSLFNVCAQAGGWFYKSIFEHPDYDIIMSLAHEENKYVRIIQQLSASIDELKSVGLNMARPEVVSIVDKCSEFNKKAYEAETQVQSLLQAMTAAKDQAQKNKLYREALLALMTEEKMREMYENALKHVKIHQVLQQSRDHFENILRTKISLFSHARLGTFEEENGEEELRSFLDHETKMLKSISNINNMFSAFSKVTNYYNSGMDTTVLIDEDFIDRDKLDLTLRDRLKNIPIERSVESTHMAVKIKKPQEPSLA